MQWRAREAADGHLAFLAAHAARNPATRRDTVIALPQAVTALQMDATSEAQDSLRAHCSRPIASSFVRAAGTLLSVAVSPDGHTVATGGFDGDVTLWDTQTLHQIVRDAHKDHGIDAIAFSPDGTLLATSAGSRIALRDPHTAEVRRTLGDGKGEDVSRTPGTRAARYPSPRASTTR
jgi:hypothetical protein